MSEHTFKHLILRDDVYSDVSEITDENGFCVVSVELQPILLQYAEKLGIAHWADDPRASLDLSEEQQQANARRIVACVNACVGIPTDALENEAGNIVRIAGRLLKQRDQMRAKPDCAAAAIQFALKTDDGLTFLRLWNEGEFDTLRKEWPDAPDEVYIGADPMLPEDRPDARASTILTAINQHMNGNLCPHAGSIGECAAITPQSESGRYAAHLYIWDSGFHDSDTVASWFSELGATDIVIQATLHEPENAIRQGASIDDGARPWDVVFSLKGGAA